LNEENRVKRIGNQGTREKNKKKGTERESNSQQHAKTPPIFLTSPTRIVSSIARRMSEFRQTAGVEDQDRVMTIRTTPIDQKVKRWIISITVC
jgi:hypothetical protein